MEQMDIRSVKIRYELQLMKLPNVIGIAIGEKGEKEVIKVYVKEKIPESALRKEDVIPQSLEGYEVDVEEIGNVLTQSS